MAPDEKSFKDDVSDDEESGSDDEEEVGIAHRIIFCCFNSIWIRSRRHPRRKPR